MNKDIPPIVRKQILQQLWILADELDRISSEIRQADKPSQLYEPIGDLLKALRGVRVVRHQWLYEVYDWPRHFAKHWPY